MGTSKLICEVLSKSFKYWGFFLTSNTFLYLSWLPNLLPPTAGHCLPGLTLAKVRCLRRTTAFLGSNLHSGLGGAFPNRTEPLAALPAVASCRAGRRGVGRESVPGQHPTRWGKREATAKRWARGFSPRGGCSAASHPRPSCPPLLRTPRWLPSGNPAEGPAAGPARCPVGVQVFLKPTARPAPKRLYAVWFK